MRYTRYPVQIPGQPGSWMEMITESNDLWERVVQYGQFQPINKQETSTEQRKGENAEAIHLQWKYRKTILIYKSMGVGGVFFS